MRNLTLTLALSAFALCGLGATAQTQQSKVVKPLPVAKGQAKAAPQHGPARAVDTSTMTEYTLSGYSIYEYNEDMEAYENVYLAGGVYENYPVYFDIDTVNGTAAMYGPLKEMEWGTISNQQKINGTYDKTTHTIRFASPVNGGVRDYPVIGDVGSSGLLLQAGKMYGIGYWKAVEDLVMEVSADYKRITPLSDYTGIYAYKGQDGTWKILDGYLYNVIFNATFYKKAEGVDVVCSSDTIAVKAYNGHSVTQQIELFNAGTTATDYTVDLSSAAYTVDQPSGTIAAGGRQLLTVTFSPEEGLDAEGTMTVYTEAEAPLVVPCKGTVPVLPDYSAIVSAGGERMTFDTDDAYPWAVTDTITGKPVAVSTNKGVQGSTSWLKVSFTVPEGHTGTFHYAGLFSPYFANGSYEQFIVEADNEEVFTAKAGEQQVNESLVFAAGTHTVMFKYDKGAIVESDFEPGADRTYLSDLSLTCNAVQDYALSVNKTAIDFGHHYLASSSVKATDSSVEIKNEGGKELAILSIEGDGVFSGIIPSNVTVQPQRSYAVTIAMNATKAAQYDGKVTIKTNAGDVEISCKADVENLPDYESIVEDGEFTFNTDNAHPFLVADGKAYNSTAQADDSEETYSYFVASFSVPAGKVGELRWEGTNDSQKGYEQFGLIRDGAMIYVDDEDPVMVGGQHKDASWRIMEPASINLLEGQHSVTFMYYKNGDGITVGNDRVEISELSLKLRDVVKDSVELLKTAAFDTVYVGKTTKAELTIVNLGSNKLRVDSIYGDGNFEPSFDTTHTLGQFATGTVTVTFAPRVAGSVEGTVTLETSAGKLVIPVSGTALDAADLLLYEDFEEGGEGWTFINDDDCESEFALVSRSVYARSGKKAIYTTSGDNCSNYAVSPEFTVPAEGATLTYYRRSNSTKEGGSVEFYEVLAGEGTDPKAFTSLYSESVGVVRFENLNPVYDKREVDLSAFAGKTIRISFWHHDEEQQYILLFDDVIVAKNSGSTGIASTPANTKAVVGVTYYDAAGTPSAMPHKGLNIVKTVFSDGTKAVGKTIVK